MSYAPLRDLGSALLAPLTHGISAMQSDSGHTTSVWMATTEVPQFQALTQDLRTNVCVVGAGIAGMTTAYLLARAGRAVVLIDDGPIGGGETGRTTAHLTSALDDRYYNIEKMHGEEGARIAAESHMSAIHRVETIASMEDIDCDFERLEGFLFLGGSETRKDLERELEATHRAGITDTQLVERIPFSFWDSGPALRFPRQASIHPLKYLKGLARAILRDGGKIYTGVHAEKIEDGEPARVTTSEGLVISADNVVVCTNTPVNDWLIIHSKQSAYRTYVIGARVPKGSIPHGLYWDTPDPYHYIRLQPAEDKTGRELDYEILIVGGEDHKTGQAEDTEERFVRLEQWTRERFPMVERVEYRWSGQIMEPVDYMAYIGKNPGGDQHIWVATGDSGNGMTHGTIAGIILNELVQGRKHQWARLYDPARVRLRATSEYLKENGNVAKQYGDWFTSSDTEQVAALKPGEGAVVGRGRGKIAVYRDERGNLHQRSAVCTHLYCIVHWNDTEKTWDCPCHGSRFGPYGQVINGPAIVELSPVFPEQRKKKSAAKR
jgi:glycine/D-amino acid oxidase-like deaminating enzyme/nitrite reductase/ring-hydroxylating ferredoxin subunit